MPKISHVLWTWLRDWSPTPTLFLLLGVHWTLLGADTTRLPTQCHECLPGCWSQAGFRCWEGMVWARSSLLGATTFLPPLQCPGITDINGQTGANPNIETFHSGVASSLWNTLLWKSKAVTELSIITFLKVFHQRFIRLQEIWIFPVTFCSTNFLWVFNMQTMHITSKKISQNYITMIWENLSFTGSF